MYLLVTRSEKYMVRAKVCHDIRGTEKGLQEKHTSLAEDDNPPPKSLAAGEALVP